ncbi:MAG: DUF3107 domain-containing protein [Actinobacteria bacterium]|nr:DUF3107 domain-containing protein [Actinomycetota bacterium]MBO0836545.1 DUF3107 domain-containing protein [Actinomycetota bacterium]
MEVKVGILSVPRELVLDVSLTREQIERMLADAIAGGGVFELSDVKGGKVLVPVDKIAYLEFGSNEPRRVGFGTLQAADAS